MIDAARGHPVYQLFLASRGVAVPAGDRHQIRPLSEHTAHRGQAVLGKGAANRRVEGGELERRREVGHLSEDLGLDDGQAHRAGLVHRMPEPVHTIAVDVGNRTDGASRDLAEKHTDRQGAAGLEALLPLLGQGGGYGPAPWEGPVRRRRLRGVEARHHQGHFEGGDAGAAPGGRGLARGYRAALADDPLDGSGEEVVGRAVLGTEPVGDGAPGALLGEQGRSAHSPGDPAELDQHRVGGLHHDHRHGRQEVVHHRDEPHLEIGEIAVGELGPQVDRHARGPGTDRVDGHDGGEIPGQQLAARPQDLVAGSRQRVRRGFHGTGGGHHRIRRRDHRVGGRLPRVDYRTCGIIVSTGPQSEKQQRKERGTDGHVLLHSGCRVSSGHCRTRRALPGRPRQSGHQQRPAPLTCGSPASTGLDRP